MRQFRIETRLDRGFLGPDNYRLQTRINREGQDEIGLTMDVGYLAEGSFDYILEKHFHELKRFIQNLPKERLFRESQEYRRMQAELDEANAKLDDIAEIAGDV